MNLIMALIVKRDIDFLSQHNVFLMSHETRQQIEKSAMSFADRMNRTRCNYWLGLKQGFIEAAQMKQQEIDRMKTQMNALVKELEIYQTKVFI
jgi:hypothetical protein